MFIIIYHQYNTERTFDSWWLNIIECDSSWIHKTHFYNDIYYNRCISFHIHIDA